MSDDNRVGRPTYQDALNIDIVVIVGCSNERGSKWVEIDKLMQDKAHNIISNERETLGKVR
jgi:hypothetical protein